MKFPCKPFAQIIICTLCKCNKCKYNRIAVFALHQQPDYLMESKAEYPICVQVRPKLPSSKYRKVRWVVPIKQWEIIVVIEAGLWGKWIRFESLILLSIDPNVLLMHISNSVTGTIISVIRFCSVCPIR